jgi:hypothetical protein
MTTEVDEVAEAFADETQDAFAFLATHGFTRVSSSPSRVRYESGSVYLELSHSGRDGEVAISFGPLGTDEEFSFTLYLRSVNPKLEHELGERLAYSRKELRDCLDKLSAALQEEGRPILAGDPQMFERMRHVRWWDFRPEVLAHKP